MGLSISKRLVTLMHGNMWVESEVQLGSRFFFTVTSQISPMTLDSSRQKLQLFQKRNILYMNSRREEAGVDEHVKALGLKLTVAHSAKEVAEKGNCPHIDTIIVDSMQVTEQIREHEHLRYVPLILLSPEADPILNCKLSLRCTETLYALI